MTDADKGLATSTDYDLSAEVLSAWDSFIDLAEGSDFSKGTRLDGWTVRELVLHLGTWNGESALSETLGTAGTPAANTPTDPDALNAELISDHADASDEEILDALRASREGVREVLASDIAAERGLEPVASQLGAVPLLTLVHAGCYELAVHALDIADACGGHVDASLLSSGVAALTDTTGCLAAREGIATTIVIDAKGSPWSFTADADGGWTTGKIGGAPHGPRVSGSAKDLLEASAGRADPFRLVTLRHLKIKHVGRLLALTPIVDRVSGIPGGRGLKLAARSLGGLFNR